MGNLITRSLTESQVEQEWWVISAVDWPLGRLASRVALVLRGKHKPDFTPHIDCGDYVIITDAAQIRLTGKKRKNKVYYRHSGYPGGLKQESAEKLLQEHPEEVIRRAVRGMLPHNILGRKILRKLKVYAGGDHPHEAQQPQSLNLD